MENSRLAVKNNKGFSLVELIIVIAIMVLMVGGAILSLSMLIGADANQSAKKMDAQLNDIKTGAMSRAGEYMIVRYIEVTDANKPALAKVGVTQSGYYAEKRATTITNATNVVVDYSTDPEFSYISNGKVEMRINDGAFVLNKDTSKTNAIRIEFNRSNGTLKSVQTGTVSGNSDTATFTSVGDITLSKIDFQAASGKGLHYIINFDSVTGKHEITRE